VVVYSVVVLLVVRELPAAITGSFVGSLIEFGAIFFLWGMFHLVDSLVVTRSWQLIVK
jgi:hypothetical protein